MHDYEQAEWENPKCTTQFNNYSLFLMVILWLVNLLTLIFFTQITFKDEAIGYFEIVSGSEPEDLTVYELMSLKHVRLLFAHHYECSKAFLS